VLNSRQKFFEIDTRFGQLGLKGIFETLDLAGVLRHRVSGVDNIEHAMKEPPAVGRARIRGQVIKRLAGGNAQCDWQSIVDYGGGQVLDISDPFTREESWSSMRRQESIEEQLDFEHVNSNDPYSRRQDAADRILSGDYAGAEELLIGLLEEGFMLPSTRCHMARVLLMTNREAEARELCGSAHSLLPMHLRNLRQGRYYSDRPANQRGSQRFFGSSGLDDPSDDRSTSPATWRGELPLPEGALRGAQRRERVAEP
jgi:hypothetical protein